MTFLAALGMSSLFFLAGMELNLARVRDRSLRPAARGMGVSLVLATAAAAALALTGAIGVMLPNAIALTTTAVGTLIPILRDAGELGSPFGTQVLASGAAGEFVQIVLIAVCLLAGFAAGLLVGVIAKGEEADPVRQWLEGIGFGLFVPFFFVTGGRRLDLDAAAASALRRAARATHPVEEETA